MATPLSKDEYVGILRDLFSGEPRRMRDANQRLYTSVVTNGKPGGDEQGARREADLVLAEVADQ